MSELHARRTRGQGLAVGGGLTQTEIARLERFRKVYALSARLDLSLHDAARLNFARWLLWRKEVEP